MKVVTFLLAGLFLLFSACSKEGDSDLITEETKTDCVWKTPNNKIIPCQFRISGKSMSRRKKEIGIIKPYIAQLTNFYPE